jgi:hypothetical protein
MKSKPITNIPKLKGYRITDKGYVLTPSKVLRKPVTVLVENIPIVVMRFPEIKGFGNLNVKYIK